MDDIEAVNTTLVLRRYSNMGLGVGEDFELKPGGLLTNHLVHFFFSEFLVSTTATIGVDECISPEI